MTSPRQDDLRGFARFFYGDIQGPRPQFDHRPDSPESKAVEDWYRRIDAELEKSRRRRRRGTRVIVEPEAS